MTTAAPTVPPAALRDMTSADGCRGYVDLHGQWHDWPAYIERPHHGHLSRDGTYTDLGEI